MEMKEILNLAITRQMQKIEAEEAQKDGPIKKHRLPILQAEYDELYKMILIEEAK